MIRDLADLANVSLRTISRVINGKGGACPKLARLVQAARKALQDHSEHVTRTLKVLRIPASGVLVFDFANPFFTAKILALSIMSHSEHRQ
jgi:DNA-binding LacI/PurR family transcriptional regulator